MIVGPVRSNKTVRMTDLLVDLASDGLRVMAFVSNLDVDVIQDISHARGWVAGPRFPVIVKQRAADIIDDVPVFHGPCEESGCSSGYCSHTADLDVVGIDSAHFFQNGLKECVYDLLRLGLHVIISTRPTDFRGDAFDIVARYMAVADDLHMLKAECRVCNGPAVCSQRMRRGQDDVWRPAPRSDSNHTVRGNVRYEPRCRAHHEVPDHP